LLFIGTVNCEGTILLCIIFICGGREELFKKLVKPGGGPFKFNKGLKLEDGPLKLGDGPLKLGDGPLNPINGLFKLG
jgi:hypothetical protein